MKSININIDQRPITYEIIIDSDAINNSYFLVRELVESKKIIQIYDISIDKKYITHLESGGS